MHLQPQLGRALAGIGQLTFTVDGMADPGRSLVSSGKGEHATVKRVSLLVMTLLAALVAPLLTGAPVAAAASTITAISPNSAPAGSGALALTVDGSGFDPGSVVLWDGSPRTTEVASSSRLYAIITEGDLASPGTVIVQVTNALEEVSNALLFTVTEANATPVAAADVYGVKANKTLTVAAPGVLANDSDADGDALTVSLMAGPSYGSLTLNADGSFTYRPNRRFQGTDAFTYSASDGIASSTATVTIEVGKG